MTIKKPSLGTNENGIDEDAAAAPDDNSDRILRLVMPGLYNPVRDSLGIPLMFLKVVESDECLETPAQVQEEVRRYTTGNQYQEVPRLTKDQKIDEARLQAREFGEEFLPSIYRAIAFWLGQKEAKKLFAKASAARRGRVKDPANFEKDREVIRAFDQSIAVGDNYIAAINHGMEEFVKQYPECRCIEPSSIRRRVKRLVDRRLRSRERNEGVQKKLKTLRLTDN